MRKVFQCIFCYKTWIQDTYDKKTKVDLMPKCPICHLSIPVLVKSVEN